jgi:hypothetical protein
MTTPGLGSHCSTMVDTPSIGGWLPIWPLRQNCCLHLELPSPDGTRAMDDRFLLKLVTVETIILATLWTLVVVYHDYFAWLLS